VLSNILPIECFVGVMIVFIVSIFQWPIAKVWVSIPSSPYDGWQCKKQGSKSMDLERSCDFYLINFGPHFLGLMCHEKPHGQFPLMHLELYEHNST